MLRQAASSSFLITLHACNGCNDACGFAIAVLEEFAPIAIARVFTLWLAVALQAVICVRMHDLESPLRDGKQ